MSQMQKTDIVIRQKRNKRVQIVKKLIIAGMWTLILIPLILCIILFVKMNQLEKQMEELSAKKKAENSIEQRVEDALANREVPVVVIEEEKKTEFEIDEAVSENTINVYLTFDDGPSNHTDDILDILGYYDVPATFFVIGKPEEEYADLYKRIVEEGHSIGMHSYSHQYKEIYADVDSFSEDLEKLQDLIYERTGILSRISRFPGGSSNTVSSVDMGDLISYLEEKGITYYDWNISSLDAESEETSVIEIVENVVGNIQNYQNAIVLMHDASDKTTTVEALPIIIENLKKMGNVRLLPITDDTVKIQHQIKK